MYPAGTFTSDCRALIVRAGTAVFVRTGRRISDESGAGDVRRKLVPGGIRRRV